MGTTTDNYDFYKPGRGERNWDELVDANYDTLDAAVLALNDDLDTKLPLVPGAVEDNFATWATGGVVQDSGYSAADFPRNVEHLVLRWNSLVDTVNGVSESFSILRPSTIVTVAGCVRVPSTSGVVVADVEYSTDYGITWTSLLTSKCILPVGKGSTRLSSVQPIPNMRTLTTHMLLRMKVLAIGTSTSDLNTIILVKYSNIGTPGPSPSISVPSVSPSP